jgi:hypothetical protein
MARKMNFEREWWYRLAMPTLMGASAVGLFKAAGIRPLSGPSASIASWVIFCVCVYGLQQMYQVIFDVVANIVDAKRRQIQRTREAETNG